MLYGVFAEVSIAKLLIAGIMPGLLTATVYMIMIMHPLLARSVARARRSSSPTAPRCGASAGRRSREIWPILVLIFGVIGGLYAGVVTPTEGGAVGAFLATVDRLPAPPAQRRRASSTAFKDAIGTSAQLFFVGIGAVLFTRFLALAGTADMFTELIGAWALDPLLLVIAMSIIYLILGMFLDPLGMMLLTIPVFVPMFAKLGLDLVWLGVLVVKYIGIGLLTPPVGFNIYVVAGATGIDPAEDDLPRLLLVPGLRGRSIMALLIAFPQISLWLPNAMG